MKKVMKRMMLMEDDDDKGNNNNNTTNNNNGGNRNGGGGGGRAPLFTKDGQAKAKAKLDAQGKKMKEDSIQSAKDLGHGVDDAVAAGVSFSFVRERERERRAF